MKKINIKSTAKSQNPNSTIKNQKSNQWLKDIVFIGVTVFLIRACVVEAYRVPTGSMENTILIGDQLFGCKFLYGIKIPFTNTRILEFRKPKSKEIVIFKAPYERRKLVKRCIGTEGDIIEIKNKSVYVNNKLLDEPYTKHIDPTTYEGLQLDNTNYQKIWEKTGFMRCGGEIRDNFGPVKVPKDCIFVMGDNRDDSFDSRFWGPLNKCYLLGKTLIIHFSWNPDPPLYKIWEKIRWNRMGRILW
ncbi:MAG: signal peptidase I [bacterium]|nr:signal peptidase I [bacterium]